MNNLNDTVGGANLFGGSNYKFVADRFNKSNSAIYFHNGYLKVPPGVYFSGDFTVTAWVNFNSLQRWQRIFDFGNALTMPKAPALDNVFFALAYRTLNLVIDTVNGSNKLEYRVSSEINLNQWYHVTYVLQGNTGTVYVNGTNVGSGPQNTPRNVTRNYNYIGKSWFPADALADATYDEIKIYSGALQVTDILKEYESDVATAKK